MPSAAENLEVVESTLRASLSQNKHLDQHVVSSTQRVLMHRITFVPAAKPHTLQLSSLKSKYILLLGATSKSGKTENTETQTGIVSGDCAAEGNPDATMNKPGPSGDAGASAGEGLPSPRVVLYPPDRVRLDWRQAHRIGAGLVNLGNTCFFNSTLQCLTYTAPLVNYCFSEEHPKTCKQQNSCLMCELRRHIRSAFQNSGHAFKPQLMLQKLKLIAKHMRWGRQEDAHEFLRYLVDGLQRACLNGYAKLDKFSKETTIINQIFGGFLRSQVQCMKCSARSNTYDPFMDLSLDIKGVYTVEDALAKFVKAETLDSDNAYKCEKCQQKVPAQKRFSIHKAPNVLTLQLNRFDYNRIAGKINRHIQFPEKLNIRPYMSQKQGEPIIYSLYGVLIHSGFHCNSGHYYCYVKAPSKTWYLMNDSMVQVVPASRVFQAEAYLLFYSRLQSNISQSPAKVPFIGLATNGVKSPGKFPAMNGSHVKAAHSTDSGNLEKSEDVGIPAGRPVPSPTTVPATPSASYGGASSLPEKHKKISFGIGLSKPLQQVHTQQSQQVPKPKPEMVASSATSAISGAINKPRIVMHIKNGKATTIEKSPDGKSKVVNGAGGQHSTLVPYDDDSESEEDRAKVNSPEGKSEKKLPLSSSAARGRMDTSASRSISADENGEQCENVKADITNGKPDSSDCTLPRRDLTLPVNRDSGGPGSRRMFVDVQADILSPSKVNTASGSWLVQAQDSAPSPSLGSCSSINSNHSVNSTTEWHVEEMPDHKCNVPADRKMQHSGWRVTESSATSTKDSSAKHCSSHLQTAHETDSVKHVRLKGEHSLSASGTDHKNSNKLTGQTDGVCVRNCNGGRSFGKQESNGAHSTSQLTRDNSLPVQKDASNSSSFKVKDLTKSNPVLQAKNFSREEVEHSFTSSDKQSLLSECGSPNTNKIVHKKHKKKKHKRDKERGKSRVRYEELQSSPNEATGATHVKHKKKKHKSRDRNALDSDQRDNRQKENASVGDEQHSAKRQKLESSEEEYTWEERTKESLMKEQKSQQHCGKQAPVQSWDYHDNHSSGQSFQNGEKPKVFWDGMRKSQVVKELEERPVVMSWDGNHSQTSIEGDKEREYSRKRPWEKDCYEEDIDKGKVKKVKKKHNDYNYYTFNAFQKFQNDKNHSKWRESPDRHLKHQPYNHSTPGSFLKRTHTNQNSHRANTSHNNHPEHFNHRGLHHSHSHQGYQKGY